MRSLTLGDLLLGLEDLLGRRVQWLRMLGCGPTYEKKLSRFVARLRALPRATLGIPLSVELSSTDRRHDGFGAAMWLLTAAYLRDPDLAPELASAIERIRGSLIPALSELQRGYADEASAAEASAAEASAAKARRSILDSLTAELELFPLTGGRTLRDWAESFVSEGEALDSLLSHRADAVASASSRADAGGLRSTIVGKLGNLRGALLDELEDNDALPPNLESLVFGYFEELDRLRQLADKAASTPPQPEPLPVPPLDTEPAVA